MKTWFVTGCSSGIGAGLAKSVLEKGDQAVVTARSIEKVKGLEEKYPDRCLALTLDVTDDQSIAKAVKAAQERFGTIDVLINNAGHGYRSSVEEGDKDAVAELFQTNLFGPIELIKQVLPGMRAQRSGAIINISSIAASRSNIGSGYYAASKAALELLSEGLVHEVEPLGIKVMVVQPGSFRTSFYTAKNLKKSEHKISDYAETAWKRSDSSVNTVTDQPGDPDKAGKAIVELIEKEDVPMRYIMGSDAYEKVEAALNKRLAEMEKWKEYSKITDF